MKILDRYIARTLLAAILVVVLILMSIEMLVVFIGELGNIGSGSYGVWQALQYVILDMPYQLNSLFPMAGLVGSLVALGVLASQSELIVMQTAGYSPQQILAAIMKMALVIVVITFIIGEIIAPVTESKANQIRAVAKSAGQALPTPQGIWLKQGQQFIHVGLVLTKYNLQHVSAFIFDDHQKLVQAFHAQQAKESGGNWYLKQVSISHFLPNRIYVSFVNQEYWPVKFDPKLLAIAENEPRNMSLPRLWQYIQYLKRNSLDAQLYETSFWQRILQPIASMVMIFLAVPFIFGPLRTVTMGLRIVSGIGVGFCFYILNQMVTSFCTLFQWPPILGALFPLFLFTMLGFFLLKRVRG